MDIRNPPRLTSLTPQRFTIVKYAADGTKKEEFIENVYPFSTLYNLKQRIALLSKSKEWLPEYQLIVTKKEDGFHPIEFVWPFSNVLQSPLEVLGQIDSRIYGADGRLAVFPRMLTNACIEQITDTTTLHIFSIVNTAIAAGYNMSVLPQDSVFQGFFQLYWPALNTMEMLQTSLKPFNDSEKKFLETAEEYNAYINKRYTKIESLLHSPQYLASKPVELRELRRYRASLPKKPVFTNGSLELLFYQLKPSEHLPFLRFFPLSERVAPLVKVYSNASGNPMLSEEILDSLLIENPIVTSSSLLLLKAPINHPRAPIGAAWTLTIFEDGSASLSIGAPRKDSPLFRSIVDAAWSALPIFLAQTPWASTEISSLVMNELNAVYEFTTNIVGKPSRTELRARLDTFTPFFGEEAIPQGSSAALGLRYKAVSNFTPETNPIERLITSLFLKDTAATIESAPIAAFTGILIKEFGISAEMAGNAIQAWINKNAEFIVTERATLAAANLGSVLNIYNSHPKYVFQLGNIESETDLKRILSLLCLLTFTTIDELRVEASVVPPPPMPVAELPVFPTQVGEEELAMDDLLAFETQMMGDYEADESTQQADTEVEVMEPRVNAAPVAIPLPLAEGETIAPIADQWYLQRLKNRDVELFEYSKGDDPRIKLYSRTCGKTVDRQPHVMAPETYVRARALYGDDVFWVELPLSSTDLEAAIIAAKAPAEREKNPPKSLAQIIASEKRALTLGFPLKQDKSVTELPKFSRIAKPEDVREIQELLTVQKKKPLWLVVRAGTKLDKPNYYICGEYWCVRDDLPLIPNEFLGTKYRDTSKGMKAPNSCPFCGGTLLSNPAAPRVGETVLQRQNKHGLHAYAGIQELYHPDKFPLPCCFVSPKDLDVPEGAVSLPPPLVPLPINQSLESRVIEPVVEKPPVVEKEKEGRDKPFSQKRSGSMTNNWYIPKQSVLGRSNEEWFALEHGAIAIPPKSVNKLLGQEPNKFLTVVKGVKKEFQNSYLTTPASAFIRFGLPGSTQEPGLSFLGLIGYAQYVSGFLQTENDSLFIPTPAAVLEELLVKKEPLLRNAFVQANYGTLLHEFSTPGYDLPATRQTEFLSWWGAIGRTTLPHQRAYAVNQFLAYDNFKNYLTSTKIRKELRHFETLFAVPGLFTTTGFILVRIIYSKIEEPKILCPTYGISFADQKHRPSLLFILEDEASGTYDPLIFYDGKDKDTQILLGLIQTDKPIFSTLNPIIREALAGFVNQYFGPTNGCARTTKPIHPWMPIRDSSRIPMLDTFLSVQDETDIRGVAMLRDRSNRLVGVICIFNGKEFYLPTLDDGSIHYNIQSMFGEEALPRPPLQLILEMLTGLQNVVREKKIAKIFPGYMPSKLIANTENYVALELVCGAWIPFEPFSITSEIRHRRFSELKKSIVTVNLVDEMPWDLDISLLRAAEPSDPILSVTSEELLNESYQHLRISFSKWINTTADGNKVRKQIELLRQARNRLPLFELQKRLDILLTSVIANPTNPWLTTKGTSTTGLLRQDCLSIKTESECKNGCTWSDDRCLIHTTATERYIDPIRVCIARLVDELLRTFGAAQEVLKQKVSYLRSLDSDIIQKTDDALLFSVSGRGTDTLYSRLGYGTRKPTVYSRGLTFPEEIDIDAEDNIPLDGINPDWATTIQTAIFAAPIQRDLRARFNASLVSITGHSLEAIESRLKTPFTGTVEQWTALAKGWAYDIIFTKINPASRIAEPYLWIGGTTAAGAAGAAGAPPRTFIILDPTGIPYQHKDTLKQVWKETEIPATLQLWMESHPRL